MQADFGIFAPFLVIIAMMVIAIAAILACIAFVVAAIALFCAVAFASLIFVFLIFSMTLSAMMMAWSVYCFFKPEKRLLGVLIFTAGAVGTLLAMIVLLIFQLFIHSLRDAAPWVLLVAPAFGFGWPAFGVALPFFLLDIFRLIFRKPKSPTPQLSEIDSQKTVVVVTTVH